MPQSTPDVVVGVWGVRSFGPGSPIRTARPKEEEDVVGNERPPFLLASDLVVDAQCLPDHLVADERCHEYDAHVLVDNFHASL